MPKVGDRFNPHRVFSGVYIPDAIYSYKNLSSTAKLLYGRLCKYKGDRGEAYPAGTTLAEELGISERQVFDHLARLVEEGFIDREPRLGTSTVYHFLWHECFDDAKEVVRKSALPATNDQCGNPHYGSAEIRTRGSADFRIGSESVEVNEGSELSPSPLPEDFSVKQTLDLEDDILTFVKNAYSRENRRAKLDNLKSRQSEHLCESIRRADKSEGTIRFRVGLLAYLADQSDWLREKRWPIHIFLSQPSQYTQRFKGSPRPAAPDKPHPSADPSEDVQHAIAPPTQPAASQGQNFPMRWNALVPERPVDPALLPARPRAYADPVFSERFEAVCEKAKLLIADGADLTFDFLLRTDPKADGQYRWQQLLAGSLTWMKPRAKSAKQTGEDFLENERKQAYARREAAKRARAGSQGPPSDGAVGSIARIP